MSTRCLPARSAARSPSQQLTLTPALAALQIAGTLPQDWLASPQLTVFDASFTQLSGTLPGDILGADLYSGTREAPSSVLHTRLPTRQVDRSRVLCLCRGGRLSQAARLQAVRHGAPRFRPFCLRHIWGQLVLQNPSAGQSLLAACSGSWWPAGCWFAAAVLSCKHRRLTPVGPQIPVSLSFGRFGTVDFADNQLTGCFGDAAALIFARNLDLSNNRSEPCPAELPNARMQAVTQRLLAGSRASSPPP